MSSAFGSACGQRCALGFSYLWLRLGGGIDGAAFGARFVLFGARSSFVCVGVLVVVASITSALILKGCFGFFSGEVGRWPMVTCLLSGIGEVWAEGSCSASAARCASVSHAFLGCLRGVFTCFLKRLAQLGRAFFQFFFPLNFVCACGCALRDTPEIPHWELFCSFAVHCARCVYVRVFAGLLGGDTILLPLP